MEPFDFLLDHHELEFAQYCLEQFIEKRGEEITDDNCVQYYIYVKAIVSCKRRLGLSPTKKEKDLLKESLDHVRKYILTVDRDQQIQILKATQD